MRLPTLPSRTPNSYEYGRIEGKLDILIEQSNQQHEDQRAMAARLDSIEAQKADAENITSVQNRLNSLELFKGRMIGGVSVTGLGLVSVVAWVINKVSSLG